MYVYTRQYCTCSSSTINQVMDKHLSWFHCSRKHTHVIMSQYYMSLFFVCSNLFNIVLCFFRHWYMYM